MNGFRERDSKAYNKKGPYEGADLQFWMLEVGVNVFNPSNTELKPICQ